MKVGMKSTQKHKNLIYDVGMNIGQDTDYYLKRGFDVIAFEADPNNADFCKEKYAKEIKSGQLVIVEGAITENFSSNGRPHKIKFYQNEDHPLWGSTSKGFASRNEVLGTSNKIIEVDAVDFSDCLEKYGIPHYLKADIVGNEVICLRALLNFENRPDYISIRSEKVIFSRLEQEFELLTQLGYDKFKAIQQDVTDLKVFFDSPEGSKVEYTFQEGASGNFGENTKGKWKDLKQIIKDYNRIFTLYWLFGDYSYLIQTQKGSMFIRQLERFVRRPLPGWYDTHAKHSSVK
jgi:FkbM family methyltransferase